MTQKEIKLIKKIPLNWNACVLSKIGIFKNGINKEKNSFGFGVPFVNLMDVFGKSRVINNSFSLVDANENEIQTYDLRKGDILFVRSSVKPEGVGQICVVTESIIKTVYSGFLIRFRPDLTKINWQYAIHCFNESRFRRRLIVHSTVAANTNINQESLKQLAVLLPPLPEQKAIAELLYYWDEIIEKIERLIQAKVRQKQGRLQSLVGSNKANSTIGSFVKPAIRKADKPTDSYLALGIRSHFKGTFQRVIEDPKTVNMDTLYRVKENDLIVNITFAWEGAIALVKKEDEKCFVSHRFPTFEIQRTKAEPSFIRQLIISRRMKYDLSNISPGGAGRNRVLNKKDFLKMPIWLPDLKTQKNIGEYLGALDREINLLKQLLEKYNRQKRGLMQKLLTGEWRLKPEFVNQYC